MILRFIKRLKNKDPWLVKFIESICWLETTNLKTIKDDKCWESNIKTKKFFNQKKKCFVDSKCCVIF